jgi:hypothetical protein
MHGGDWGCPTELVKQLGCDARLSARRAWWARKFLGIDPWTGRARVTAEQRPEKLDVHSGPDGKHECAHASYLYPSGQSGTEGRIFASAGSPGNLKPLHEAAA